MNVGLRVNPAAEAQGGAMRMGGGSTAFGVDEEMMDAVLGKILSEPAVELRGLHLFSGTQILDDRTLLRQYRKALDLASRAGAVAGRPLATLDFGGGLGIPYFSADQPLDVDELGRGVASLIAERRHDHKIEYNCKLGKGNQHDDQNLVTCKFIFNSCGFRIHCFQK